MLAALKHYMIFFTDSYVFKVVVSDVNKCPIYTFVYGVVVETRVSHKACLVFTKLMF